MVPNDDWMDDISSLSIKQLEFLLNERNIDFSECFNRKELVGKLCNYLYTTAPKEYHEDKSTIKNEIFEATDELINKQNIEYRECLNHDNKKKELKEKQKIMKSKLLWSNITINDEPLEGTNDTILVKLVFPELQKSFIRRFMLKDNVNEIINTSKVLCKCDEKVNAYIANSYSKLEINKTFIDYNLSGRVLITLRLEMTKDA